MRRRVSTSSVRNWKQYCKRNSVSQCKHFPREMMEKEMLKVSLIDRTASFSAI